MKDVLGAGKTFRKDECIVKEVVDLCKNVEDDPTTIDMADDDLVNAHHVAVSLSPDEDSNLGVSQVQILDLALNKIKSIPDQNVQENVRETLSKD